MDYTNLILELYINILGNPIYTYGILGTILGYYGWDKYIRAKFIIHVCIDEGNSLQEMKKYSLPIKKVGTTIKWVIAKHKKGEIKKEDGRSYIVDGQDVVYKDRFNKRHIIQPYNNAFSLHPYTDEAGKLKLVQSANAKADHLFQVISQTGFLARVEGLRKNLGKNMTGTTLFMIMILAVVAGVFIGYNMLPIYLGAPQGFIPDNTNATIIERTVTKVVTSVTSSTSTVTAISR